jgi:hypothetical protein
VERGEKYFLGINNLPTESEGCTEKYRYRLANNTSRLQFDLLPNSQSHAVSFLLYGICAFRIFELSSKDI